MEIGDTRTNQEVAGGPGKILKRVSCMALLACICISGAEASTILINFETVPAEPTGPSSFAQALQAETITVPGVATFTGGVILGDASHFPAQGYATAPNIYATTNPRSGHGNWSSTLDITFNSSFAVTQVSFPLFNGVTSTASYMVDAYDGNSMVASQTLANLPSNTDSGYGIVDLKASAITSVTITPSNTTVWDYAIDSVALNETVGQAINGGTGSGGGSGPSSSTPEPTSMALLLIGGGVMGGWYWRRSRNRVAL